MPSTYVLVLCSAVAPLAAQLQAVRPGVPVTGTIGPDAATVETEQLEDPVTRYPVRGQTYRLEIPSKGTYTIELRSPLFDAYLVLRDQEGATLGEDDNGLPGNHARIVAELDPALAPRVVACALFGEHGDFELRLDPGQPPASNAVQRARFEVEELREIVAVREEQRGEAHVDTARAVDNLAASLCDAGRPDEALPLARRALAIRERELPRDHFEQIESVNNVAATLAMLGQYDAAIPMLEQSLAMSRRVLGTEHVETAHKLKNLAAVCMMAGRYRLGIRHAREAVDLRRGLLGDAHPAVAESRNDLARLLREVGQLDRALELLQQAWSSLAEVEVDAGTPHGVVANNLGQTLMDLGRLRESRPILERAVELCEATRGADHPEMATQLSTLANLLLMTGHYERARALKERAILIWRSTTGADHPYVGVGLNDLGIILDQLDRDDEAVAAFEEAIAIYRRHLGDDHAHLVLGWTNLGCALDDVGRQEDAYAAHEKALRLGRRVLGEQHPSTLTALHNLAASARRLGREEARGLIEEAYEVTRRSLGDAHFKTAIGGVHRAFMVGIDDPVGAVPAIESALGTAVDVLGPSHPRMLGFRDDYGSLLFAIGRTREAFDQLSRAVEGGVDHLLSELWIASERDRFHRVEQVGSALNRMLAAAAAMGADERAAAYEAFIAWKGIAHRSMVRTLDAVRHDLTAAQEDTLAAIRVTQSKLSGRALDGDRDFGELQRELDRLQATLSRSLGARPEHAEPTVAELARALPPSTAWIDFYVHRPYDFGTVRDGRERVAGEWRDERLSAWILRPGAASVQWIDLGPAAAVRAAVDEFLGNVHEADRSAAWETANRQLVEGLWEPLRGPVADAQIVYVSPDRFLGGLPFGVLRAADGSFLLERHRFVYAEDATTLAQRLRGEPSRSAAPRLLAVGGVDYAQRADWSGSVAAGTLRSRLDRGWAPLPQSWAEAAAVGSLHRDVFGQSAERTLLRGDGALEERVKAEAPTHDCLHLSTHGFFARSTTAGGGRPRSVGLAAGLVLAGANEEPDGARDDGLWTAAETAWLDLAGCELVVLSACETGIGTARSGQGMSSLRRAFHQAGADTVISSLWKVEDEATRRLMLDFYTRLWRDGQPPLEALHHARLAMLDGNRRRLRGRALPATWGAFVLSGEWR